MQVSNVHSRCYPVNANALGALVGTLSSPADRLWPVEYWPPMKLDGPLAVGATGGHAPIRYAVEDYVADKFVRFRFTYPKGFNGTHTFEVIQHEAELTELRHSVDMLVNGTAWLLWMTTIGPLHDALVEDALAKVSGELGQATPALRWSYWVRFLRWGMSGGKARARAMGA